MISFASSDPRVYIETWSFLDVSDIRENSEKTNIMMPNSWMLKEGGSLGHLESFISSFYVKYIY